MTATITGVIGGAWIRGLPIKASLQVYWVRGNYNADQLWEDTTDGTDTGPNLRGVFGRRTSNIYGELYLPFRSNGAGNEPAPGDQFSLLVTLDNGERSRAAARQYDLGHAANVASLGGDSPYLDTPAWIRARSGAAQITAECATVVAPANTPSLSAYCFERREALPLVNGALVRAEVFLDSSYGDDGVVLSSSTGSITRDYEVQSGMYIARIFLGTAAASGPALVKLPAEDGQSELKVQLTAALHAQGAWTMRVIEGDPGRVARGGAGAVTTVYTDSGVANAAGMRVRFRTPGFGNGGTLRFVSGGRSASRAVSVSVSGSTVTVTMRRNDYYNPFSGTSFEWWEPTYEQVRAALHAHSALSAWFIHGQRGDSRFGFAVAGTTVGSSYRFAGAISPVSAIPRDPLSATISTTSRRITVTAIATDALNDIAAKLRALTELPDANVVVRGDGTENLADTFFEGAIDSHTDTAFRGPTGQAPQLALRDADPPTWRSLLGTPAAPNPYSVAVLFENGHRHVFSSDELTLSGDDEAHWTEAEVDAEWNAAVATLQASAKIALLLFPDGGLPPLEDWVTADKPAIMSFDEEETIDGLAFTSVHSIRVGTRNAVGLQGYVATFGFANNPDPPLARETRIVAGSTRVAARRLPATEEEHLSELQLEYRPRLRDGDGNEVGHQVILRGSLAEIHKVEGLTNGKDGYFRTRSVGDGGITVGPEAHTVIGRTQDGFPIGSDQEEGQI